MRCRRPPNLAFQAADQPQGQILRLRDSLLKLYTPLKHQVLSVSAESVDALRGTLHHRAADYRASRMSAKRGRNTAGFPRVSVGIPPPQLARLERLAASHERSVAWVVRHAVRLFLDDVDKGQIALDLEPPGGEG